MCCWSSIACWINPRCASCTLLTSSITVSGDSSQQDLIHLVKVSWAGHRLFCRIFFISGWTRSYHFLWAPTCLHFSMCSWVSSGSWHLGHLWESTASGDIFDFWHPVLSQPCILLDVLIRFKGPSDKKPDLIPFQSILSHVTSSQSYFSCRYFDVFHPVSLIGSGGECEMWLLPHPQIYLLPSSQ
jgi:hypothetical protein